MDFSKLDAERQKHYDARTLVGREVNQLKAKLATLPQPVADIPEEEVSAADVLEEQRKASEHNAENQAGRDLVVSARRNADFAKRTCDDWARKVSELESLLAQAKKSQAVALDDYEKARADIAAREEAASKLQDIDLAPFAEKIKHAEATNRAVRAQKERKQVQDELAKKEAEQAAARDALDLRERNRAG